MTQSKLYIDGVEQTLTPILFGGDIGTDVLTDSPRFGGWNPDLQFALDGRFDDISIWHGARSAADIAADMNGTIDGPQPGLVAAYTSRTYPTVPAALSTLRATAITRRC